MTPKHEAVDYALMSCTRHNIAEVASLIYASAPALFNLLFGTQAIACLTEFVRRSQNRFSHQYIRVATINHQVIGIVTLVPAVQVNTKTDDREVLNRAQRLWIKLLKLLLLRHLVRQDYPPGSLYIGNLAVAAEHRNQGIGRQLLSHCMAAAQVTSSPIFISVDVDNPRAQTLYESLGFRVVEQKTIRLLGTLLGSRVLSWSPPDLSYIDSGVAESGYEF